MKGRNIIACIIVAVCLVLTGVVCYIAGIKTANSKQSKPAVTEVQNVNEKDSTNTEPTAELDIEQLKQQIRAELRDEVYDEVKAEVMVEMQSLLAADIDNLKAEIEEQERLLEEQRKAEEEEQARLEEEERLRQEEEAAAKEKEKQENKKPDNGGNSGSGNSGNNNPTPTPPPAPPANVYHNVNDFTISRSGDIGAQLQAQSLANCSYGGCGGTLGAWNFDFGDSSITIHWTCTCGWTGTSYAHFSD